MSLIRSVALCSLLLAVQSRIVSEQSIDRTLNEFVNLISVVINDELVKS